MATILIVDDVPANRKVLVAMLGAHGHQTIEAVDGGAGLAVAKARQPDLIITDVLMPVMDGYELLRQLRLDPTTKAIPVVFNTAHYGEREARALALASGVAYVMTKPTRSNAVLDIVTRALAGQSEPAAHGAELPLPDTYDQAHLRLLTDKLSAKTGDLRAANARLRAVINIGLELSSVRDSGKLLGDVCVAARDLFAASYATLGLVEADGRVVSSLLCGEDEGCGVVPGAWIRPGEPVPGVLRTVIDDRRAVRGDNRGGDPAQLQLPGRHPEVRAFLAAPITSPARVYGWICLVCNDGRSFSEEDEGLLLALTGQVGRIYELEIVAFERSAAETALSNERDWSQRYLDTAEIILVALDSRRRITMANRYACAVLGWTREELLGQDWVETCIPMGIRDLLANKFNELLQGSVATFENPVLTRSGEERLFEWHNTLLRDSAGAVVGVISSGTDITERKRAAADQQTAVAALRITEERMRYALNAAGVGIWDMDYTTGAHVWSETLEAQYGLAPGTFEGSYQAFIDLIHPDDREAVLATIEAAMKIGTDFSVQHRTIRKDGSVRWLRGLGRVQLGGNGKPLRAVGISLDITDLHSLEAQYLQAQKMEAIGRLAGGVAHDFNNLLTGILGYCELLLSDLTVADPHRHDVAEIQKAGLSAATLTRQLLAFSRKQIIEPTRLDMNVVIEGMRAMLERLIGEDVRILLSLDDHLAPVRADRGQIEQILMNLALNARDAMPTGGRLTIETANVELDADYSSIHLEAVPGRYVVLTVTDSGSGMSAEVQARLFEPFFTTKEIGKGTGLGLATVHGIVKQSGGSVNVYSEVGHGTSFKVYLPRDEALEAAVAPVPAGPPRRQTGPHTVLVVEDAEGLRELTARLLQRQGFTVLLAGNAEEATRIFDLHPSIEVLLTDVVMPGISGPELAGRLLEQRKGLRVVYMSGYTEDAIVQHGVLKSGIAFLHKPFTSETLGGKIREVLDLPQMT